MTDNQLIVGKRKLTAKKFKIFCEEFSTQILAGKSSKGNCAIVTWALSGYLSFMGLPNDVYQSHVGSWNHLWIMLPSGEVIDCTADQFNRGKRKHPQVHIGNPLDIHRGGKRYEY